MSMWELSLHSCVYASSYSQWARCANWRRHLSACVYNLFVSVSESEKRGLLRQQCVSSDEGFTYRHHTHWDSQTNHMNNILFMTFLQRTKLIEHKKDQCGHSTCWRSVKARVSASWCREGAVATPGATVQYKYSLFHCRVLGLASPH